MCTINWSICAIFRFCGNQSVLASVAPSLTGITCCLGKLGPYGVGHPGLHGGSALLPLLVDKPSDYEVTAVRGGLQMLLRVS